MLKKFLLPLFLFGSICVKAQFKHDDVLYKTVDPSELCSALEKNKGYLLLDVRSKGEYEDTAAFPSYNLGRLKGAMNINVRELGKRLHELKAYKNKPVFIYCSHSQRSRRASKMLADSGFTKVYNVNGGMSSFYYSDLRYDGCLQSMIETKNKYAIISSNKLCGMLNSKNIRPLVIDVRPDSAFRHISLSPEANAYGIINGSVNIPLAKLSGQLPAIEKDHRIILVDLDGADASKAAVLLLEKGYTNVSVLEEGIDRLLLTDEPQGQGCRSTVYQPATPYPIITAAAAGRLAKTNKGLLFVDLRSTEEFNNKHAEGWRNIGHLTDAINLPAGEIVVRMSELDQHKERPIVLYGIGSNDEVFAAANALHENGFKNIHVLAGGLFNYRWTAGNIKGNKELFGLVVDTPEENR